LNREMKQLMMMYFLRSTFKLKNMRKLIIFILAVFSTLNINAQIDSEDSVRTVILETINYFGRQKKQQDRLLDFYTANKTSTTEDILSKLPELSLVPRGNYGMEPVIRSFNGNQINLLLDGRSEERRVGKECRSGLKQSSLNIRNAM